MALRDSGIDLVFTVALAAEIPIRWLRAQGVRVCEFEKLRGGAVPKATGRNAGVLFLLTGMGPEAARRAARWIREELEPRFVVNLGTAGALGRQAEIGDWVSPRFLYSAIEPGASDSFASDSAEPGGEGSIEIDDRVPFPWPDGLARAAGGSLLTVSEPQLESPPPDWARFDCVDMEAFEQARSLAGSGIAFHVCKGVSDRPGENTEARFRAEVRKRRTELERILGFLAGPEEADITAVIPVHDRRERIVGCVESVIAQSLPPREVIVVDDGSGDGTAEALAGSSCGDRARVVRLPHNLGVSAARNRGVAEARSPWIAFLDSDDRWEPDKLARQWQFARERPHYLASQSEEIWIRRGVRVNRRSYHAKPAGWIWRASLERCLVTASALLVQKRLLEELGGFDEALPVCEDYDLWIRLARWHPVGLDPSPTVVKYGGHADQLSRRYPAMDRYRVLALLRALDAERDGGRAEALADALRAKLQILAAGSRHRDNRERTHLLERILASLDAQDFGRPHGESRRRIREDVPSE